MRNRVTALIVAGSLVVGGYFLFRHQAEKPLDDIRAEMNRIFAAGFAVDKVLSLAMLANQLQAKIEVGKPDSLRDRALELHRELAERVRPWINQLNAEVEDATRRSQALEKEVSAIRVSILAEARKSKNSELRVRDCFAVVKTVQAPDRSFQSIEIYRVLEVGKKSYRVAGVYADSGVFLENFVSIDGADDLVKISCTQGGKLFSVNEAHVREQMRAMETSRNLLQLNVIRGYTPLPSSKKN